jgi:hypothetical protein
LGIGHDGVNDSVPAPVPAGREVSGDPQANSADR